MVFLANVMALRGAILAASVKSGRPVDELAALARVSARVLGDRDARLSHDRVAIGWAKLATEVADPALGLFTARLVDTAASDLLQPLLAQARTLGDAVQLFLRFQQLYHSGNASRSYMDREAWVIEHALHRGATPSVHLTDFVLGNWVHRMRRAVHQDLPLLGLRLRRPAPLDPTPYRETFGPNVLFSAKEDSLRFAPEAAKAPIAGGNEALRAILERQAKSSLEELDPGAAFLGDARTALEVILQQEDATLESLARTLATSSRTLQRRLASCETTFQSLVDSVRHELALKHLARGHSVTETAGLLGFSELSAFSRAFRRWTGHAPRHFLRAGTTH